MFGRTLVASFSKRSTPFRSSGNYRNICGTTTDLFARNKNDSTRMKINPTRSRFVKTSFLSSAATTASLPEESTLNEADKANITPQEPTFVPSPERKYEFFQNVELASGGIAMIRFDNPNKKVNTISFKLKDEAEKLWKDEIENNSHVKGVVFTSGKPDGFIAGKKFAFSQ